MPRKAEGLTAQGVKAKNEPGRYGDGSGLYLLVREDKRENEETRISKFFLFRYVREGRMREMGLGPASGQAPVSLADARRKARELLDRIRDGRDPLAEKLMEKQKRLEEAAKAMTFSAAAKAYMAAHAAGWKNAKHAQQWKNTLAEYVEPVLGPLPVQAVDVGLVLKVIEPLWQEKTETASRVRGRIEAVLDWATARGYRTGDNPARWKGHLDNLLPAKGKVAPVEHHAALPYTEMGAFMAELRQQEGAAARALELTILTAARTGETIGATWPEIDPAGKVWIVPAERMKAGKEHRVPLSARAVEIIEGQRGKDDVYVFPGGKADRPLSNMALLMLLRRMGRGDLTSHGFRSTFRDWAAERSSFPAEVAEMALAHTVSDKVEAAYRRGDMFEKRRRLAEAWARHCATPARPEGAAVASIGASR